MADRYWVGGTGTWTTTTTNWSATSGGAGGATVPTAADNVFFDANSNIGTGAFTVTVGSARTCLDLTVSGLDGAMTLAGTFTLTISGSLALPATNFNSTHTGSLLFSATTAKTINTNGVSLTSPITFNGVAGSWTLQSDFTTNKTVTLTNGSIALGTNTLRCGTFVSTGNNARAILFGTGNITTTGSGVVWNMVSAGFSYTGTPTVNISNNTATAATIATGAMTAAQALNFNINAGTYALTLTTGNVYNNLNFTGFAGTVAFSNTTHTMYGNLNLGTTATMSATATVSTFTWNSTSGTRTITSNGRTSNFGIALNGVGQTLQLADAFIQGSTQTFSLVNGTFDMATYSTSLGVLTILGVVHAITNGTANAASVTHTSGDLVIGTGYNVVCTGTYGFNAGSIIINDGVNLNVGVFSSASAGTRSIAFGTGSITTTGTGTVWNVTGTTGLSYTGTSNIIISNNTSTAITVTNTATAASAMNFGFINGTYALTLTAANVFENLDFTGFNGSCALGASTYTIYGNLTIPTTGGTYSATAGTNTFIFASTSGTSLITTNGRTINFGISINGLGGTVALADALIQDPTQRFSLVNGTFDMATYSTSLGVFTILTGTHAIANGTVNAATVTHTSGDLSIGTGYLINCAGTYTFTAGTITINDSANLSIGSFSSAGTGVRSIGFGTGSITITGSGTVWNTATVTNFSYTGTSTVNISNNTATAATITPGTMTTAQALNFNINAGTYELTLSTGNVNNLSFVGFSGSVPLGNTSVTVYGNLSYGANTTSSAISGAIVLSGTSPRTITTNGALVGHNIALNGVSGTFTLQDAFTGTGTLILTNGTLDLGNYTLSINAFSSSNSNVRSIAFGTGQINITSSTPSSTIWDTPTVTNFTYTGTSKVNVTYSGLASNRVLTLGAMTETNALNFNITAGVGDFYIGGSFKNLDFTGFGGFIYLNSNTTLYGNLTIPATASVAVGGTMTLAGTSAVADTQLLDTNGETINFNLTMSGTAAVQLVSNLNLSETSTLTLNGATLNINSKSATIGILTIITGASVILNGVLNCASVTHTSGSIAIGTGTITCAGTYTFTSGTININNSATLTASIFNSNNINARVIAFGTGRIVLNGSGTTIWNTPTPSNLSYTGTSRIDLTYSGGVGSRSIVAGAATEASALNFNITAGTDSVILTGAVRNLIFTGFGGIPTLGGSSTIYGNLTIPAGLTTSGTFTLTLAGTTGIAGTQILDTNGVINNWFIVKSGTAGLLLASTLTLLDGTNFTLTNGALDLNGKTLTITRFIIGSGTKSITFNSGTIVCTGVTTLTFDNSSAINFTTSAGTGVGTISMTGATSKTFTGGGANFAAKLNQGGSGTLTITGSNTFDDITNTVQPASILFTAGTTTTVNNFSLSGTTGNLITIGSVTAANHTLSKASGTVTVSNCSISRSTATGGATWRAPNNLDNVDGANNTGWSFAAIITAVAAGVRNFFSFF